MRVLLGIMARWLAQPATALHAPALTAPLPVLAPLVSQTAVMVSVVMPVFWAMKDGIVKGAPQAITEILKLRVALARGVTAAQGAPFTVTVTVGPGSVSAGQALLGSDVRNVSRGTFWWKAIVFLVMMNVWVCC